MEEKIFMDKGNKPTEQTLQDALGDVYQQYRELDEMTSAYQKEWAFTKGSGWMLKVFDAKKALFYLIPLKRQLKISMAIRENERDLLLREESLAVYQERLQSAKKFSEGYAIQFLVAGGSDLAGAEPFLEALMRLRR